MQVILASGSPRRKELMSVFGFPFTVEVSGCEETASANSPGELAQALAIKKAKAVAKAHPRALVIGADTLVVKGKTALGKPSSRSHARDMLQLLQGSSHEVVTGYAVCIGGRVISGSDWTTVQVAPLSPEEIDRYLDTGEYTDKAGSYAIQGYFSRYIPSISGSYANVVGLPVHRLYPLIQQMMKTNE